MSEFGPYLLYVVISMWTPDGAAITSDRFFTVNLDGCEARAAAMKNVHEKEPNARSRMNKGYVAGRYGRTVTTLCIPIKGVIATHKEGWEERP